MSAPLHKKILIANRGVIARRILRTLKRLGIPSVAVYSNPDAEAPFVKEADERVALEGDFSKDTYLNMDKVIAAAKKTGATAIHPGYGFLSEKAVFARRCKSEGIAFIGPSAESIDAMGDKASAREAMIRAGVPVIPGSQGVAKTAQDALREAERIGYPVLLKASAGGGGIGMLPAANPDKLVKAFQSASDRASQSFGDASLYVEKHLEEPRHIEVQVFADRHGNFVHLGERECSVQRRHQKIIEETPSPLFAGGAHAGIRDKMYQAALDAARSVSYEGAGTVEFLVDRHANFYFIEMNTRLQVEHTVTEQVTRLDLVEAQLRVAAGEPLPFKQADIVREGCAIQLRIYAENPAKGFIPSPGKIARYVRPSGEGIRVDAGVEEGSVISHFYDPMIDKLIGWGATRDQAIERLLAALEAYVIEGIHTNIAFHKQALASERFRAGRLATDFVDDLLGKKK